MSVRRLANKGYHIELHGDIWNIKEDNEFLAYAKLDEYLYMLECQESAKAAKVSIEKCHDNSSHVASKIRPP